MLLSIESIWSKNKWMQEKPDYGKSRQRLDTTKKTEAHLILQSYSPNLEIL